MKKLLSFFCFFILFSAVGEVQKNINQTVFDAVINEIAKNHFDGNFRQNYAQKIKEFRQIALKSVNNQTLAETINKFLRGLPDSHFGIIPPPDKNSTRYVRLENSVKLLETDGKVFVKNCSPCSKFKKGDELLSVKNNSGDKFSRIGRAMQFNSLLTFNAPDEEMPITVRRNGRIIKFNVTPKQAEKSPPMFKLGEMPPITEDYESSFLKPDTACVCFSAFTPHALQSLKKDIRTKFKNTPNMVIDLRNNVGGLLMIGVNMASFLSDKKIDFGTMVIANQPLTPKSYPQKNRFKGKIYILIGRNSYSTAEIFALAMHEANAAVLIGERTAGMCLPSVFIRLPHNFRLQTVVGDYRSSKNYRIEGKGVFPSISPKHEE